jgi:hypothetical protein
MFVMSACTALISICGLLLSRTMRVEMRSRAQASAERNTMRLAEQLRDDCHEAKRVVVHGDSGPQDDKALLQFDLASGRRAEYRHAGSTLLRVETGGDRPTWREEYVFPTAVVSTVRELASPQRVEVLLQNPRVEQAPADGKSITALVSPRVNLHIEAVVGRDLRFQVPESNRDKSE